MKKLKKILLFIYILGFVFFENALSQSGWTNLNIGVRNYVEVNFINSSTGFIIGDDKTILKTTNTGLNWIIVLPNIINPTPAKGGSFNTENIFSMFFTNQIYFTTNAGISWNYNSIQPAGNGIVQLRSITITNDTTGYVCGSDFGLLEQNLYLDGIIYKTTNSGANWFQSFRGGFDYYDIKFINEMTGYAIWAGVMKTTNGGGHWVYAGEVSGSTFSLSLPSDDTLYMSSDRGKIYRSINRAISWDTVQTPAIDTLKQINFVNAKTGYACGDSGAIVKTTNAGLNWNLQFTGTAINLKSIWFINKDTGFAVGDNGKILRTFTGGLMVDVKSNSEIIPNNIVLSQNYPNPFNPVTNLEFGISDLGFTSLKVYDMLGKEVSTLVNEKLNPGTYKVEFDGSSLPGGVYFYRLTSGDFTDTRRMMLIK